MSDKWAAEELEVPNQDALCVIYNFPINGQSFRLVSEQAGGKLEIRLGSPLPRATPNFEVEVQFDRHPALRERADAVLNVSGTFEIGMNFRGLAGFEAALRSSSGIRINFIGARGRSELVAFSLAGIGPALRAYLECKERFSHM